MCLALGSSLIFNQQQVRLASYLNLVFLAVLVHWFARVAFERLHNPPWVEDFFPWVQDLHKPVGCLLHLGPMFSCGVTFAHGGSSRNKDSAPH